METLIVAKSDVRVFLMLQGSYNVNANFRLDFLKSVFPFSRRQSFKEYRWPDLTL